MNFLEFKQRFQLELNPQQEQAVQQTEGPVLLLAVPGSGKTTVLVSRLGYMLYSRGIAPEEIAKYAESIGVKGIGLYDTFVHIDTRESKSFWYGHGQERRTTFGGVPEEKRMTVAEISEALGYPVVIVEG